LAKSIKNSIYTRFFTPPEEFIQTNQVELKFFSGARDFEIWFQKNSPDLVMSDINMPDICGLDLGHRIRKNGPTIPTYFVSGHDEKDYVDAVEKFGKCRYISKPINISHLLASIKTDLVLKG